MAFLLCQHRWSLLALLVIAKSDQNIVNCELRKVPPSISCLWCPAVLCPESLWESSLRTLPNRLALERTGGCDFCELSQHYDRWDLEPPHYRTIYPLWITTPDSISDLSSMPQCRQRQKACPGVAVPTWPFAGFCHLAILTGLSWQHMFGRWHHRARNQCWGQLVCVHSTGHQACQDVYQTLFGLG